MLTYPYSFGTVRTKGILAVISLSCSLVTCRTWICDGECGIDAGIVDFQDVFFKQCTSIPSGSISFLGA